MDKVKQKQTKRMLKVLSSLRKIIFSNIVATDILTEVEILMLGHHQYPDVLSFKTIRKLNFTDSHQC